MKNSKELAFLYDLYIAPDWSERFAGLIDEHIQTPKSGRVLYVEAGTGGHALELSANAGQETEIVSTDSDAERIALAQAKATVIKDRATAEFLQAQPEDLPFEDAEFDVVIADLSLISATAPERLPEIIGELARVARGGGVMVLAFTTRSSFGEFFSLYWEALASLDNPAHAAQVETLIKQLPQDTDVETIVKNEDFSNVQSWTVREEFEFASGAELFTAPLIDNFLIDNWFAHLLDTQTRDAAQKQLIQLIDDERQNNSWTFSIKATLLVAQRGA